jgi:hypothetical protein
VLIVAAGFGQKYRTPKHISFVELSPYVTVSEVVLSYHALSSKIFGVVAPWGERETSMFVPSWCMCGKSANTFARSKGAAQVPVIWTFDACGGMSMLVDPPMRRPTCVRSGALEATRLMLAVGFVGPDVALSR